MSLVSLVSRFVYGYPVAQEQDQADGPQYTPIPQPPGIPLLGNVRLLDRQTPFLCFQLLWKTYGDIYCLEFPGRRPVIVNSHALALEILDEKRFHKAVSGGMNELRTLVGDGLFTAHHGEPNWVVAHRILVPAFSPASIKGMFDDMFDICSQLVLKWERFGPEHSINPAEDFTRLAFDTVSLCTMGYRVNSFYNDTVHPFVTSMGAYLQEAQRRATLPTLVKGLISSSKWDLDRRSMNEIVDKVIKERKKGGNKRGDLIDLMLDGKDPQTGLSLDDENIRYQLLTFLIAGHETTSGMLSFIIYELLKTPHAYAKVREEVDTVLQGKPIRPEHLGKLPYIVAVMREGLRLHPPAPMIGLTPFKDEVLGGKYFIPKGTTMGLQVAWMHRDPLVWGSDDVEEFRPERMLDGKFEALPPKAWLPFGNGARACIGRAFSWQEATIALATLFQRFDLVVADSSYDLKLKQTLTLKPDNFYIHAIPRKNTVPMLIPEATSTQVSGGPLHTNTLSSEASGSNQGLCVLYGSNTGTSESFAQRIASGATARGFNAHITSLDAATGRLSTKEPTIIITASFEGQPADNAGRFVEDLIHLNGAELSGVSFAVFACGNRDWATSYQRIPRLVDEKMAARGATRLLERGEGDASGPDFFDAFDVWEEQLWGALSKIYMTKEVVNTIEESFSVEVYEKGTERAISLRQPDAVLGAVIENRLLTADSASEKRHLEIKLPEGLSYSAGDYLAILPTNPAASVNRVLKHFNLSEETVVTINAKASNATTLPTGRPVELKQVLSGYVELSQPASKHNLQTLANLAEGDDKRSVQELLEKYKKAIVDPRLSVLDILQAHPSLNITLGAFLSMLPAMRVRQYSISSSPLWNPEQVTLTVSVINSPSLSGSGGRFLGVASNFLANLQPGDLFQLTTRPSANVFSLPADTSIPLVLFCAGSGIAPMRGFIQERAMQIQSGRQDIGKILLFFGCRTPESDFLYSDTDLKKWVDMGVVDLRPAFSRTPDRSEGCRYVQDRVLHDGEDVKRYYREGAKFLTCGGSNMAAGVRDACLSLIEQHLGTRKAAMDRFSSLQKERYATDIFS